MAEMNQLKPKKELLNANYDVMLQLILTIAKLAGRKTFWRSVIGY